MAEMVKHLGVRWLGHLECKSVDDWVLACRNVEAEMKCRGRGRKT